jgi:hypothetical protein
VKLAFDENVPLGMVRVFHSLAKERALRRIVGNFDIVCAQNYTPKRSDPDFKPKDDVPWLTRYASDGGRVVVSGDCGMLHKPHELLALKQHGFIVVFFENSWSSWDFFKKSSLLLHYWTVVAKRVSRSRRGAMWRVPGHWRDNEDLRRITVKQDKLLRGAPAIKVHKPRQRKATSALDSLDGQGARTKRTRRETTVESRQGQLDLGMPEASDQKDTAD